MDACHDIDPAVGAGLALMQRDIDIEAAQQIGEHRKRHPLAHQQPHERAQQTLGRAQQQG